MVDASRIAEAENCVRKAEKYLKTSILSLKFKPDYDSAASAYERAGVCYKNAKKLQECKDVYLKAADCHENNGIIFHAAKCKEQAALVYRDLGDTEKAKELMLAASQQYAETGTPETSAQALDKAAKFFETLDPQKAIEIYEQAFQLMAETDKIRQSSECLNRITKIFLKLERLEEAAVNTEREIDLYAGVGEAAKVGRLATGLVLVQLARGDSVEASKVYHKAARVPGFERTEDAQLIRALIGNFEAGDEAGVQNCFQSPHMRSLDNEFLRLMKTVHAPKVEGAEDADDMDLK